MARTYPTWHLLQPDLWLALDKQLIHVIISFSEISWVENGVVNHRGVIVERLWSVYSSESAARRRGSVVAMVTTKKWARGNILLNSFRDISGFVLKLQLSVWDGIDKSFDSCCLTCPQEVLLLRSQRIGVKCRRRHAEVQAHLGENVRPFASVVLQADITVRLHVLPCGNQLPPPPSHAHPTLPPLAPVLNPTLRGAENN